MLHFQALFEPADEGGFVITFPDFEWGVTQGDSEEEAAAMAAEVIEIVMEDCISEGKPLPVQRRRRGKDYRAIRLPALVAAKAELYSAFLKSGITKAELARRLNIPRMNVDRLFQLRHQSRLGQIEAALHAIGKDLEITIHNAAYAPKGATTAPRILDTIRRSLNGRVPIRLRAFPGSV